MPFPAVRWRSALALAAALAGPASARAEPYLALRQGLSCASCHVNRTGGGARTAYGSGYGRQSVPWKKLPGEGDPFDGVLTERVRLGADLRAQYLGTFQDPGPYVGEHRLSEANLYLSVDLIPDRITLYVDEEVAPGGALNREAFALVRTGKAGMYVKAGRFYLPYGLRLQDDGAATRQFTGFNFNVQDVGVEFGADAAGWSTAVAASNGTAGAAETNNGKQLSWIGSYGRSLFLAGLSASANDLPGEQKRSLGGGFGGVRMKSVQVLAEWDLIREDDGAGAQSRAAARHLELDWQPEKGFNVRFWAGRYDPDRDQAGDGLNQAGVALEWTVLPGVQVRTMYRSKEGPGYVSGANDAQVLAELHLYF